MTLGGQYDWTKKVYPDEDPPPFPSDVGDLLRRFFPETRAQAAILNLYSPGDTLSLHRDVSEESEKGLISISIGCDAIFIVGLEHGVPNGTDPGESAARRDVQHVAIRLRSGDAVYMSGAARFAWHGVPRIIPGSCPDWLKEWPAQPCSADGQVDDFEAWRGWMGGKRINLNVRQMFDDETES
jgi:DNA alkylation damage repair protein AlkB